MKTIRNIYRLPEGETVFVTLDDKYEIILRSFQYKIIIRVDENGYSGDIYVVFEDDYRGFGYLCFGFGSCTGCDALKKCKTVAEAEMLQLKLHNKIRWFESLDEMLEYLHDDTYKACNYEFNLITFQTFLDVLNLYIDKEKEPREADIRMKK